MQERSSLTVIAGPGKESIEVVEAQRYLARYGYVSDEERASIDEGQLSTSTSAALRRFQRFARLHVTGTLTLETLKLMRQPRCPIPDLEADELGGPGVADSDPFVFTGDTWDDRNLRWFIQTGTPDLTDEGSAIQRAFDTWAASVPLTFTQVSTATIADFTVSWATGDHGDHVPVRRLRIRPRSTSSPMRSFPRTGGSTSTRPRHGRILTAAGRWIWNRWPCTRSVMRSAFVTAACPTR